MQKFSTLIEPVILRAKTDPEKISIVFIPEKGQPEDISALKFHHNSLAYARALQKIGVKPEDLVILVLRNSPTLLYAFWGSLYLGAIVSIFPFLTEKLDPVIYQERVKILVTNSGAKVVITFPEFQQNLQELLHESGCRVLSTDDVPVEEENGSIETLWAEPDGNKIAFLQHSSGTTGLQKGVALSHRAVLNHLDSLGKAIDLSPEDSIVSWLPLYHDMGLIGGFVFPLVTGNPLIIMSPFHWVRDPKTLFQLISKYRATLCWLPNFAFNHCVRTIRERDFTGLDLSSMRAFINCSEPARLDSISSFIRTFSSLGVKPSKIAVSYGMAENTFAATQTRIGEMPRIDWVVTKALQEDRKAIVAEPDSPGSMPMVSCGSVIPRTEIAVVDSHGRHLSERQVGEFLIRSDCMLTGYYRRPELTKQMMIDGWFYSGDIGYIADGQIYVSGRKKDMIIVGGKNVFPQDIEAIANTVHGVHPGRAVAFGVFDEKLGSEKIILVCEQDDPNAGEDEKFHIERELRKRVVQQTEVTLGDVRLVEDRWLIKTSSGKIARSANRDKYLQFFSIENEDV